MQQPLWTKFNPVTDVALSVEFIIIIIEFQHKIKSNSKRVKLKNKKMPEKMNFLCVL